MLSVLMSIFVESVLQEETFPATDYTDLKILNQVQISMLYLQVKM